MLSTLNSFHLKSKMFLIAFMLASGCSPKLFGVDAGAGIPRQVYDEVPLYVGPVNSVGTLTQAYIRNTEGLLLANSRLNTLCIAYGKCEPNRE